MTFFSECRERLVLVRGISIPTQNLVNNYYYRFLSEITGSNSKILRAYFRITPKDWLNLSFSDAYFFEGQYWSLNQISDYNPIEDGVYLCEFLLQQFIEPATIVQKTIGAGTAGAKPMQNPTSIPVGISQSNPASKV
jgi:hypothetical protein